MPWRPMPLPGTGRVLVAGAAVLLGTLAAGSSVSGCSLITDATNAGTAPLTALPETDVVVETNLETGLTTIRTAAASGLPASQMGGGFVQGPSTGPDETSFASSDPGSAVIVSYNNITRDCLGIVDIASTVATPILGEGTPGTYYFVAKGTPPGGCAASSFAAESTVPSGWPSDDPSSSGFPAP